MALDTREQSPALNERGRFRKYKVRTGMLAWAFHRLAGLALVLYLIIHVWGLRSLGDKEAFNNLIVSYHAPLFKVGEFFLLAAITYHAMNGLRIVLIDFLGWSPRQKKLFWTLGFVALVILLVGGYPSLYAVFAYYGS